MDHVNEKIHIMWFSLMGADVIRLERCQGYPAAKGRMPGWGGTPMKWFGMVLAGLALATGTAQAQDGVAPQFNSFSGQYQMAAPGAVPKFNSFTGGYEMASPDAAPKFNPFTGQHEMASPGSMPKFNSFSGQYEMGRPGTSPQFNPFSGTYEYAH